MTLFNIIFLLLAVIFFISIIYFLFRINLTINEKLKEVQGDYIKQISSSQSTLTGITEKLTELKNATQNILHVGENIQSLQDILKPPKLRGELGELMLEQIIAQVLPHKNYKIQHKFQTGNIVDAAVMLKDSRILCIDSKFPLNALKDYISNGSNDDDIPAQFIRDVKKHIDSIASKYILPNEGTLDFALMYIPAENVYYEIILRDEKITNYAREKNVLPVSPLTLYSYLSAVLLGLKGFEIEKNARVILKRLGDVKAHFNNFQNEFNTLGMHINNMKTKYESSKKISTEISEKLSNIEIEAETENHEHQT